ncbi:bifunctional 4-hydroxy-2-oxoglutarate aldolase/2-dehydro-3-deoxy-phosphogluconate aldolase [Sinomonas atrocyanea]
MSPLTDHELTELLAADRTLAVVRAASIPDAAALAAALRAGGVRSLELTLTTPGVLTHVRRAVEGGDGTVVGVGTVMTGDQARAAIDAGAQFLVTPGIRAEVARVAVEAGVPVCLGAMTPSEVAQALDLGSSVVKVFPARQVGPAFLKDLQGPFPGIRLLPSGGSMPPTPAAFSTPAPSRCAAGPLSCRRRPSRAGSGRTSRPGQRPSPQRCRPPGSSDLDRGRGAHHVHDSHVPG